MNPIPYVPDAHHTQFQHDTERWLSEFRALALTTLGDYEAARRSQPVLTGYAPTKATPQAEPVPAKKTPDVTYSFLKQCEGTASELVHDLAKLATHDKHYWLMYAHQVRWHTLRALAMQQAPPFEMEVGA